MELGQVSNKRSGKDIFPDLSDFSLVEVLDEFPSIRRVYEGRDLGGKSDLQGLRKELLDVREAVNKSHQELEQCSLQENNGASKKDRSKQLKTSKDKKQRDAKRPKLDSDISGDTSFQKCEDLPPATPATVLNSVHELWDKVDEYFQPVTQEEVQAMKRVSKRGLEEEWHDTPCLGRHYLLRWGEEEESSGPQIPSNGLGPLTLRLLGSLIQDSNSCLSDYLPTAMSEGDASYQDIETNVRNELISFGVLDDTDFFTEAGQEDEILAEIKRKQNELQNTTQQMRKQRKTLILNAQKEILNRDLSLKLEQINSEICEAYKKLTSSRQKKKQLSKKERDQIASLVEQREELVKKIAQS